MSYHINAGENAATAIRRMVREQAEGALETAAALEDAQVCKAAHSIRKRIKKIRALLRLVREEIGEELYREENQRLRAAAHCFSQLRDADMQRELVENLHKSVALARETVAVTLARLEQQLQDAKGAQKERARELSAILEALEDRLEGWPLHQLTLTKLASALCQTYREARRCLHYALDHRTPRNFHTLRKQTKNVWYQARVLQQLNPAVLGEICESADAIGKDLGDLHDLAFLREQLNNHPDTPTAEMELLLGLICAREKALAQRALDLGCRFFAEKPGVFGRRLLRYAGDWPSPAPSA